MAFLVTSQVRPDFLRSPSPILAARCPAPEAAERLAADFRIRFGTPLHPIGRITSGPGLVWLRNGKPEPLDWHGFEHY